MSTRRGILFLLLLLVPALAVGLAAVQALRHEQERLRLEAQRRIEERIEATAAAVESAVGDTERWVTQTLLSYHGPRLADSLHNWRRGHPLIRNVFIWQPRGGLQLPDPAQPATQEEAAFIRRYDALFTGRAPWQPAAAEGAAPATPLPPSASRAQAQVRQQLLDLAVQGVAESRLSTPAQEAQREAQQQAAPLRLPWRSGWLPWLADNNVALLGWVQTEPDAPVYGVELEMAALLARLLPALRTELPPNTALVLGDGTGRPLHQSGSLEVDSRARVLFRTPVGPALPHWELLLYGAGPLPLPAGGHTLLVLGGTLVGIFLVAILAGGLLLLQEARRSALDARRKTTFVANVSHELKTPLTTIRMYAELLGEGRVRDETKARHYLRTIIGESQRLSRLIGNVLDFGRLEQRRKVYRPERLDPAAAVAEILARQQERLDEAGLRIETAFPAEPAPVRLDRDSLEQVLLNLVDNALKYAAGGRELRIAVLPDGARVRLRVEDRGPGVPAAERERVFDLFHRLDDTLTRQQPGCGLGLTLSRKLLRDQGGDLLCEARLGGGAAFVAVLPAAAQEDAP